MRGPAFAVGVRDLKPLRGMDDRCWVSPSGASHLAGQMQEGGYGLLCLLQANAIINMQETCAAFRGMYKAYEKGHHLGPTEKFPREDPREKREPRDGRGRSGKSREPSFWAHENNDFCAKWEVSTVRGSDVGLFIGHRKLNQLVKPFGEWENAIDVHNIRPGDGSLRSGPQRG